MANAANASPTASKTDEAFMRVALGLARRGLGSTWPNPSVGCVIVDAQGRVAGAAATASGGRPHAETQALAQAGDRAQGATAYVTLEPCAHHGQTPPCAEALIAARVTRVVVGATDHDPRVGGRGITMLRAAGIAVTDGILEADCIEAVAGFFMRLHEGRPFVTVKSAMSLDGRIATASGESQWITGPEARLHGHVLRSRHDAILCGIGTVLADDPVLTVRPASLSRRAPARILADTGLSLPMKSRLVRTARETPLWILCGTDAPPERGKALASAGVEVVHVELSGAHLNLNEALKALGGRGLTSVLVEGGGTLIGGLAKAGLIDRIVAYRAGLVLGGDAVAAIAPAGIDVLADATRYRLVETERCGADVVETWDAAR